MAGTSLYIFGFCFMAEMFSAPQAAFLFCACLAFHHLAIYSVFRSLIKQTLTATATSTMAVYM